MKTLTSESRVTVGQFDTEESERENDESGALDEGGRIFWPAGARRQGAEGCRQGRGERRAAGDRSFAERREAFTVDGADDWGAEDSGGRDTGRIQHDLAGARLEQGRKADHVGI